jgi:mannose-6-phosphate isomerase-like protein (cupin superfamily)
MQIESLSDVDGRTFPAGRLTKNLVGGSAALEADNFNLGYVELDPDGGQVPWHNHEQEEIYLILEGTGEMCVDDEIETVEGGQVVYIPPNVYHQLTNVAGEPLTMIYCYAPAGDVDHWRHELDGTLPKEGEDVPPLPEGARPQITRAPEEAPGEEAPGEEA